MTTESAKPVARPDTYEVLAMARSSPDRLALLFPEGKNPDGQTRYGQWTYRQLDEESDALARGLHSIGVRNGVRTVLMVKPSPEFFALTLALSKLGAVPVMVDPGMPVRSLARCLAEAEPQAFIGIPKAHAARVLYGWARKTVRIRVTCGRRWFWGGYTLEQLRHTSGAAAAGPGLPSSLDQTAALFFTSGSTGSPKGTLYTRRMLTSQIEIFRRTYDFQPGEIDLCTFPLFALFAPSLGMTTVIPVMDPTRPAHVDPAEILTPMERFGVTNLFGSPALLHRVASSGQVQARALRSLRRVISFGAPMSSAILEQWARWLPEKTEIFTFYGATEALPVASIGSREVLRDTSRQATVGAGVCVGRPVEEVTVRIIHISDGPIPVWSDKLLLPPGEIGEIVVQGPTVTREYYN
ncbi:MAG: AMP-binding protein, partial [Nevskiales bacterium]|nr:AMP-binding protein [Nevskiales bacterium]